MNQRDFGNICKEAHHHPYTSPGHVPFCFPLLTFYLFFFSQAALKTSIAYLTTPILIGTVIWRAVVEAVHALALLWWVISRELKKKVALVQFLLLFCPACSWDEGVCEARGAWSYSSSTNLIAEGSSSLLLSLSPDYSWWCPCDRASSLAANLIRNWIHLKTNKRKKPGQFASASCPWHSSKCSCTREMATANGWGHHQRGPGLLLLTAEEKVAKTGPLHSSVCP